MWKTIHQCDFSKEDDFLEKILNQAGVEDIYEFLHENKSHTYDPFLFRNMEKGIDLLHDKLNSTIYKKEIQMLMDLHQQLILKVLFTIFHKLQK